MNKFNSKIGWNFDNTYVRLPNVMLSKLNPIEVKSPKLVILNDKLSEELNLDFSSISQENLALIFSGNILPKGSESIAQAYAGHQFGHFTNLGDGRAIVIGEHLNHKNKRFDIQFKGSGKTPYSRNGDGRAALGPMLREYIVSEAMHSLNIPTTRSLAVVKTGENVIRESILQGAILTRVASSHIRVGTFQYLSMQNDLKSLRVLVDYTMSRHYPDFKYEKNQAIILLNCVMESQMELVVNWMRVGFIHGVMNTDNTTISGETIDYGPCAFMDFYNPETVFSSIDYNGRYAFFNQPGIIKWNLSRFAESLLPLIDEDEKKAISIAEENINKFGSLYKKKWLKMMRKKLGLIKELNEDENLINDLLLWMNKNKSDYTNTFVDLIDTDLLNKKKYKNETFFNWHKKWEIRKSKEKKNAELSIKLMKDNNPYIIPRNHKVEEVLKLATTKNNFEPMQNMLNALKKPYNYNMKVDDYQSLPTQDESKIYKTFCGT